MRPLLLQDLVRQMCVTIADHGAADFAVGSLIVELISSDGNWEAIMIGLKALLSIFMAAPARAATKQATGQEVRCFNIVCPAAYCTLISWPSWLESGLVMLTCAGCWLACSLHC